mgnify:CR=1 FL=1
MGGFALRIAYVPFMDYLKFCQVSRNKNRATCQMLMFSVLVSDGSNYVAETVCKSYGDWIRRVELSCNNDDYYIHIINLQFAERETCGQSKGKCLVLTYL